MRIPTAEITVDGRKKIVNADDPRTRLDVQKMSRPEVVARLQMLGIRRPSGKIGDLRAQLDEKLREPDDA